MIRMEMENGGVILLKLDPENAPITCANFEKLVKEGFYDGLFQRLKEVRTRLAQRAGVPAYVVFSNATLADMAVKLPTDREEFLAVNGVGEQKADRYGKEFLAAILDFLGEDTT